MFRKGWGSLDKFNKNNNGWEWWPLLWWFTFVWNHSISTLTGPQTRVTTISFPSNNKSFEKNLKTHMCYTTIGWVVQATFWKMWRWVSAVTVWGPCLQLHGAISTPVSEWGQTWANTVIISGYMVLTRDWEQPKQVCAPVHFTTICFSLSQA